MTERDKVTVDNIIGLVHTDEMTNSVSEVRKLRGRENKTEKRFTYMIDRVFDLWGVYDNKEKVICLVRNTDAKDLCDLLNELHEENKQLKKDATTLIYANQDYRQQNQNLQEQLDYIQNSISEHIKHQKTELGQKALQEIIGDYNEWLLGHKELIE